MRKLVVLGALFWSHCCFGQTAEIIKLEDLKKVLGAKSQKIQIVNFWATWCGPCIKELPLFEKITADNLPDVKVMLVSLDLDLDPDPQKVYRFIARKNLRSEVVLLDESDPNSYINEIDSRWSGALPATLLINQKTGERKFIGNSLHEGDLEKYLEELR